MLSDFTCCLGLFNLGDRDVPKELFLTLLHDFENLGFNVVHVPDEKEELVTYLYLTSHNEVIYFGYTERIL